MCDLTITAGRRSATMTPMTNQTERSRYGNRATHIAALMAVAVVIALAAPGRTDGAPDDAVATGMVAARHCEPEVADGINRWADCIRKQEAAMAPSTHARLGVHFQAWLTADHAARGGKPAAFRFRDVHAHHVARALDENQLTLHRLCTAGGLDCDTVEQRLAEVL
jgi:hypothetical protein